MMKKLVTTLGVLVLFAAMGCGGSEEAQLEALSAQLDELRAAVESAQGVVEEKEQGVAESESQLADARAKLAEAEEALAALEREAGAAATDPVLFRLVQKRLLEDAALEDVAVAALVENGVVSLSGEVPTAELRTRAGEIAQDVPGVASVENRIRVLAPVAAQAPAE